MFCIRCGAWMKHKSDCCEKCDKFLKEKAKEIPTFNFDTDKFKKSYNEKAGSKGGNKSVMSRRITRQQTIEELEDTHYTVSDIVELTGRNRANLCKQLYRRFRKQCLKLEGMYFIPKRLLPELEKTR